MRGFLPITNPLRTLPAEYYPIEELQKTLPELFGTNHLRPYLKKFPEIKTDFSRLACPVTVAIAKNCLFAASAFIHNHNQPAATHLPRNLARLIVGACDYLQVPPILSYNFYCLNNWYFINQEDDFNPDNLHIIQGFIPDDCENWFIVIHVSIEHCAGAGLTAFVEAQKAIARDEIAVTKDKLLVVVNSLEKMIKTLRRMPEHCRPEDYYHRVRPQIQGFNNVVYGGVKKFGGKPQSFRGETGAQSSIIPAFIRFLGIKHQASQLTQHLDDMLNYMPPAHRAFEGSSIIRDYIIKKLPEDFWEENCGWLWRYQPSGKKIQQIKEAYNDCLKLIHEFRKIHLGYAISYIQEKTGDRTGTGGTPYVPWLTQMKDETLNFLL